ncbi:MAG: hypothetical protein FWC56_05145, partial [Phycisphaerae bacterium]|nr:hypothetical protein [Phycisphaerae bacterium]
LLVIHRCTPGFLSVISPVGLLLSLLSVLTPGVMLVAIGLVAPLIVDQRPAHEQYIIAERVGWCATTTTLATTADKVESQNKP